MASQTPKLRKNHPLFHMLKHEATWLHAILSAPIIVKKKQRTTIGNALNMRIEEYSRDYSQSEGKTWFNLIEASLSLNLYCFVRPHTHPISYYKRRREDVKKAWKLIEDIAQYTRCRYTEFKAEFDHLEAMCTRVISIYPNLSTSALWDLYDVLEYVFKHKGISVSKSALQNAIADMAGILDAPPARCDSESIRKIMRKPRPDKSKAFILKG